MTFEELKQQFIDNGFQINGDSFVSEIIDNNNISIVNGVRIPNKMRFEMTYIGEGGCIDDSDSDIDSFYSFEVLGPGRNPVYIISIKDFDDFNILTKM